MDNVLSIKPEFKLRKFDGKESEYHFVLSSWLKSYRKHGFVVPMPTQSYFENYRPLVSNIIRNSEVYFAVDPTHEDHLFGFVVYRLIGGAPVVSFAYVKTVFRQLGIGTALINHALDQGTILPRSGYCTHTFKWLDEKMKKMNLVYNPFLDLQFLPQERKAS